VTTIIHMLAEAAARNPSAEALVCDGARLAYGEYVSCVAGFAAELRGAARVALLMGNGLDIAIAMFAAQAAGAQVVPLNPAYTPAELGPILADADPQIVVAEPDFAHLAAGYPTITTGEGLLRWRDAGLTLTADLLPDPDSLAALQYTGGTTGRAKGVDLTHRAIATNILQRHALIPAGPADRVLSVAPMFHVYAIATGLHLAAHAGACLVQMRGYEADALLDLLAAERISLFLGIPRLYGALLDHPSLGRLPHLCLCLSGSAPLPEAVLHRWEATTGAPICEGYGQTEAGPILTYNPEAGPRKPGSVGVALPGTEVEIVDIATGRAILPIGDSGEIRARGPQIMAGYRNRPAETAAALRDGWLHTGDIGAFDADGYLFIRGRLKEMVIVSGFNVYPREIEEALHAHPAIAEAAVIGRPDPLRGEALAAFVVLRAAVAEPALRDWLAERLTRYKLPSEIRFVDALPRTGVGKIDKQALARGG
jgi:long-chain acyl-CoA synthetase